MKFLNLLTHIVFVNIVFLWNSLPVSECHLNSRKVFRCSVLNYFICVIYVCFCSYVCVLVLYDVVLCMYVVFVEGVLIGFCLLLSPVKVFHKSNQSFDSRSFRLAINTLGISFSSQ